MTSDREVLARNLRDARENRALSQQAVADELGLSRTVIAQIELGNRPVSPDELAALAGLYGLAVVDLVSADAPNDDELLVVLFDIAPELLEPEVKARLGELVSLSQEVLTLERALERPSSSQPPRYDLPAPRTAAEAVVQGERVARDERLRLGSGASPACELSELLIANRVRSAAVKMPEQVVGVTLQHDSVGTVVLTNWRHSKLRRRFALMHEYGHVLMDRERTALVTKRSNAGELIEKRANAFATAFLLPEAGLRQLLLEADKGHASRRDHVVFDIANERAVSTQTRSAAGSQVVTYQDALAVARRFGTSYPAAVCRLLALAVLSESDAERLLSERCVAAADTHRRIFDALGRDDHQDGGGKSELLEIKAEIVGLTVEAYRRQVIKKAALTATATRLRLPALSPERLIELAEATWQ